MPLIPVFSEVETEGAGVTNKNGMVAGACNLTARRLGEEIMSTKIAGLHREILPKRLKKKKILTRYNENECSSLFSVAVISTMTKSNLEKRGFISAYISRSQSNMREIRAVTQAETKEKQCLLARSLLYAQLALFLYSLGMVPTAG